jgi:sister-chromatid-cohesion protein PDS5
MPARTRRAAPAVAEVMEEEHALSGLQFNEPLSWRAGKPISIADLLRRLQALSREMREMEQEENERDSFTKVAKELVSPNLLAHKDKGVRAWTACCLVDILRLCAPDAPYTGPQLKVRTKSRM